MGTRNYWPIWQITLSRLKEFLRAPAAVFWVYGFPILMMISLGTAFRDDPEEQIAVDVVGADVQSPTSRVQSQSQHSGAGIARIEQALASDRRFKIKTSPAEDWRKRLQAGKTDLVVEVSADASGSYQLWDEPHRTESRLARYAVEAALLRGESYREADADHRLAAAPGSPIAPEVKHLQQAGSRYIDFLLPGMIGMGLMGGGLWGVGFVVVDMRMRKLLKRFLATPMRKADFLLGVMCSRLLFTLGDVAVLLLFGYFVFDVRTQGSYFDLAGAVLLGSAAFAGIGLLVASRAETLETVSGLMNLVMLPMWILSGVFFSSERFPEEVQPLINLLPLTALNQLLRGIILEGRSLLALWPQAALLGVYAVATFSVGLRVFRWR
jgi:ABC-2 type transport system permease protein